MLSLLGGEPLAEGTIGFFGWLGCAAFISAGVAWFAIVWPRTALERTAGLLRAWRRQPLMHELNDQHLAQLVVAEHLEAAYRRNEKVVARIASIQRAEMLLLLFAVVCWVAELVTKG